MARTDYKATAAQARFIAHLASVKLDGTVEGLVDYYEDSEAGRLDYGYAYRSGSTLIQVARGMNKKAASALIDELKALPDYQSEPEPADDPEPEAPAAEAEGQVAEDDEPADGKVVAYYEIDENRGQVFEAFYPFDLVADKAIDENGDVSADWLAGCFRIRHMGDDLRDLVGLYPAGDLLVPIPGDPDGLCESVSYTEAKDWASRWALRDAEQVDEREALSNVEKAMNELDKLRAHGDAYGIRSTGSASCQYETADGTIVNVIANTATGWLETPELDRQSYSASGLLACRKPAALAAELAEYADLDEAHELDEIADALAACE